MDGFVINATTGKASIEKDPNAVLDYTEDWTAWLSTGSDQIISSQVFVASDQQSTTIVATNPTIVAGTAVVSWISGGMAGEKATITFRVVTQGGRTDDRSFTMKIKDK